MNKEVKQLVIVCRNIKVDWSQFVNPLYVGVENGTNALLENNLPIAFACGDFDHVTPEENAIIWQQKNQLKFQIFPCPAEKDYLDAEMAIIQAQQLKLKFNQIVLITEGKRWDMIYAQMSLINKYHAFNPILISENNYVFLVKNNDNYTFSQKNLEYKYISLFPFENETAIYNFKGCQYYPNQDITINNQDVLAISNQFSVDNTKKELLVKKGQCLVFLFKE